MLEQGGGVDDELLLHGQRPRRVSSVLPLSTPSSLRDDQRPVLHRIARVHDHARKAQVYDFVANLSDGFDTAVGERGLKLSGGEKQRVAIARTILKDPPILILGEATSALDTNTEQEIQTSLEQVSKGRTTVTVAHRLSTIKDANLIIVLDHGKIVEQGTHDALIERDGAYASMWNQQQRVREYEDKLREATA